MTASGRLYQGESADSRTQTRRQLLIDVAFALMATEGWREVSINQLCRDAGLNKRYFYESFADLPALEAAVIDDLAARLLAIGLSSAQEAQQQGLDTGAMARRVMREVIGWLADDPRRARVLFGGASGNAQVQAHRAGVIRQLAGQISTFGQAYHGEREALTGGPGGEAIGLTAAAMLIGGSMQTLLGWLDGHIDTTLDEMVDYMASFWVAVGSDAVAQAKRRMAAEKKPSRARRAPAARGT
jgi:AcrR family transcriptional regulator